MFAKSKVSQSMIDAVNKVLGEEPVEQKDQLLNETAPIKEPTSTGMRVYGGSYGNSAKAKQDQTKKDIDKLKGPKDKEMKEEVELNEDNLDSIAKKHGMEFNRTTYGAGMKHPTKGEISINRYGEWNHYPAGSKSSKAQGDSTDKFASLDKHLSTLKEELKGNQDKIDANHNGKIDGQDFKILRGKKKVKEGREFTEKLLETVRKSDVPAYLRKAKGDTPLTVADVKAPKKDTISAPENLAKARNEEVEQIDELSKDTLKSYAAKAAMGNFKSNYDLKKSQSDWDNSIIKKRITKRPEASAADQAKAAKRTAGVHKANAKAAGRPTRPEDMIDLDKIMDRINQSNRINTKEEFQLDQEINEVLSKDASAGDWIHDFVHSDNPKFAGKSKAERKKMALGAYYGAQKEAYEASNAPITTDTLAGRMPGGKSNSFKSFKVKVKPLAREAGETETPDNQGAEKTSARATIKAEEVQVEATIAGTSGWKEMKKDVKDKSGAIHSPMSRAKDLARQAFKSVSDKTKVKS